MSSPNGWKRVPLSEVCRVVEGQVDPRDSEYRDLPHINGEVIESGTGRLLELRTAAEDRLISGKYLFEPGMVLYSKLRPYLRKVAIAPSRGLCSADMYPLTFDPQRVDAHFAMFSLLAEPFTQYAIDESRRARMPKLNRAQLMAWEMALPDSVEVQRQIAADLTQQLAVAHGTKRAAEERLATAEALSLAFYRDTFGNTAPLSAAPTTPSDSIRSGWRWRRLTDVARLATGHTPSRRSPEYWGGDIPWLQLPDIRALDGQTAIDTSEHINRLGIENSAAVPLPKGTVCLSRTASVGFVTIMGREMATSQDFVNWVCGPEVDPVFLMHVLIASRRVIHDLGSGAVHHTIYFPTVEAFSICAPSIEQQRSICADLAERLAAAASLRSACRAELRAIETIPAASLRGIFGGDS